MTAIPKLSDAAPAPSLDRLLTLIDADMRQVNAVLLEQMAQQNVPLITQLASHIIAAGGKRLRPALTLACSQLCGYSSNRHVALAACVELIHTATLLHDDVVDESKTRRGFATANEVWDNKSSVLVGDYMLSRAFQLMVADGSLDVLKVLSDASAIVAQGEVKQLITANDPTIGEDVYFDVVSSKTAALFEAACELGAIVSNRPEWRAPLIAFGHGLGIAFQLADDIMDYASHDPRMGKDTGDDFRDGKVTLPVIFAYRDGSDTERSFWKRTFEMQDIKDGDFEEALSILNRHSALERSKHAATEYAEKARQALQSFPANEARGALEEVLSFCIARMY